MKTFSKDVQYTFPGIQHNHSLIDHFIVSQNLVDTISHYFTADSVDNLSDHLPLFCHLSSVIENVLYAECDNIETPYVTNKSHWHYASDKHIHDYHTDLDITVKSYTLPGRIITCINPSTCSHRPQITTFHDKIIFALNEAMHTHISNASNKNKRKRPPTIPGWDAEMLVKSRYIGTTSG